MTTVVPRLVPEPVSGERRDATGRFRPMPMSVVRVFTGPDGQSHFEDVDVELDDLGPIGLISSRWPARGVQFREVHGEYHLDFHNAPRRQLVVNLTGSVEIEVGSGERRTFGPGSILLADDTTGQGHISRSVDGEYRTCLFVHLGDQENPADRDRSG